ncbi:MAG: hypothetical protein KME40_32580 [Komarekiella atlantica HA4396-MV6]|jgi:hypothetical protein|nr:hypothetical protein [Komarekiella atlantica HA4396-MV6]
MTEQTQKSFKRGTKLSFIEELSREEAANVSGGTSQSLQNPYGYGLNLNSYCKQKYGSSSKEVLIENNAYGWRCLVQGGNLVGINIDEACQMHYGYSAKSALGNYNDPSSWYCNAEYLRR